MTSLIYTTLLHSMNKTYIAYFFLSFLYKWIPCVTTTVCHQALCNKLMIFFKKKSENRKLGTLECCLSQSYYYLFGGF